jgi:DNA-binding CsgD family transcriptional regulator
MVTIGERERHKPALPGTSPETTRLLTINSDDSEILAVILTRLERIEEVLRLKASSTPHLTAREAADYLRISYSTFRKKATRIRRQPGTGRYRIEDLDEFAASLRPRLKR